MARLIYTGVYADVSGTKTPLALGASLTNVATTVTFNGALKYAGGTAVPTIASPDYLPVTVVSVTGVVLDAFNITAYTAGATTATVIRAAEGYTALAHSSGAGLVHGPTALDISAAAGGGVVSGTYLGPWIAGAYKQRDVLSRDGVLYAALSDTSTTPTPVPLLLPTTPVGGAQWSRNSVSTYTADEVVLVNGNGDTGSVISSETFTGFDGQELFFDISIAGGADEIQIGILDAAQPVTSLSLGMNGVTGFWGASFDIWAGQVIPVINGTRTGGVNYSSSTGGSYVTHSVKITGTTMEIRRAGALVHTQTITAPTFSSFRLAVGARTGGVSGTFKVRGTPGVPATWQAIGRSDSYARTEVGNIEAADFVALFEEGLLL